MTTPQPNNVPAVDVAKMRNMITQIKADPKSASNYTREELLELRKFTNVYGNFQKPANEEFINISIINNKENYMRNFLLTTMIGHLQRMLFEYEPEIYNEKGQPIEMHNLSDEARKAIKAKQKFICAEISKFLSRNYTYDVDRHVREVYSENPADPDRRSREDLIKEYTVAPEDLKAAEEKLAGMDFAAVKSAMLTTYQKTLEAQNAIQSTIGCIVNNREGRTHIDDLEGILAKKVTHLEKIQQELAPIVAPMARANTFAAVKNSPPVDVFHHLKRYATNHWEQLKQITDSLYNEKSDIELSVIYYGHYADEVSARKDRMRKADEFKAEVYSISNSGISLIGPFRENRKRVDFYNKNTEVLKRMGEQMEADHKLGMDLMEKQIKNKKKKNIEQTGKDAGGLDNYIKAVNTIDELGAKRGLTRKEQEELDKARIVKIQGDTPVDAIAVEVLYPTAEGTIEKTHFYTQAEDPKHLDDGSEFRDKYQPARPESAPDAVSESAPEDNVSSEATIVVVPNSVDSALPSRGDTIE